MAAVGADGFRPDLSNDVDSRLDAVKRWHTECAVEKTIGVITQFNLVHLEGEWALVCEPSRDFRLDRRQQIGTHIHEYTAGSPTHPFQYSTNQYIHIQRGHIHR